MYLLVLDQVGLLAKGLGADLALEGLFPGVRPQMDLDVALVEEATVADRAPVHRLFLAPHQARVRARAVGRVRRARGGGGRRRGRAVALLRAGVRAPARPRAPP